jgi:hypothetical protein
LTVRTYMASSVIDAPAAAIWDVLIDGANWPQWDSAVVRVDGTIAPGQTVTVYPEVNPKYTGPLAGLIAKSIPDRGPSFTRFAQGLKRRVEGGR